MKNDTDSQALEQIVGDMDGMESDRMFKEPEGTPKGVSIKIDVTPKVEDEMKPEAMVVEEDDDSKLPPFLRKQK